MKAFVVEVVTPTGLPITQVRTEADDPVEAGKQVTGSDDLCCEDYGYPGTLRAKVYDEVEDETWIYRMYDPIDGDEQDEDHQRLPNLGHAGHPRAVNRRLRGIRLPGFRISGTAMQLAGDDDQPVLFDALEAAKRVAGPDQVPMIANLSG